MIGKIAIDAYGKIFGRFERLLAERFCVALLVFYELKSGCAR